MEEDDSELMVSFPSVHLLQLSAELEKLVAPYVTELTGDDDKVIERCCEEWLKNTASVRLCFFDLVFVESASVGPDLLLLGSIDGHQWNRRDRV